MTVKIRNYKGLTSFAYGNGTSYESSKGLMIGLSDYDEYTITTEWPATTYLTTQGVQEDGGFEITYQYENLDPLKIVEPENEILAEVVEVVQTEQDESKCEPALTFRG